MSALGYASTSDVVVAYRFWRVMPFRRLDGTLTYRLCAMGTNGTPKVWEPMQATRAVCSDYGSHHEAPWADHECGLWALTDLETARKRMTNWISTYYCGDPVGIAIGQVSLWGRVIEHEKGWRAQYAYPYALTLETPDEEAARVIRREYAVDVEWAGGALFERGVAKRLRREDLMREKEAKRKREFDESMERLREIGESLKRKPAVPAPRERTAWDVVSEVRYGVKARATLLGYVRGALNAHGGAPVSSSQIARHMFDENGLGKTARDYVGDIAHIMKDAMYAREVVQVKKRGVSVAHWTLPGKPIPVSFALFECPHAAKDDAMLERFRGFATKHPGQPICTRDFMPPGSTSRAERTLIGQSLGRLGLRGAIREIRYTGSHPNEWELVDA